MLYDPRWDNPITLETLRSRPNSTLHEQLTTLSLALRQPLKELFNFDWNFAITHLQRDPNGMLHPVPSDRNSCGSTGCAIGLRDIIWPNYTSRLITPLSMDDEDHTNIFLSAAVYNKRFHEITPHDVADAIDEYLETHTE